MIRFEINQNEAGQRFDKYLKKVLKEAPSSFVYKMLRKKNITLNGKKSEGSETLLLGDEVTFFFADETFEKFSRMKLQKKNAEEKSRMQGLSEQEINCYHKAFQTLCGITVLFENEDLLILNKPAGVLSQKASPEDSSINEWMIGYLLSKDAVSSDSLVTFKPSVCNRLDRNTSGIILCGKSLAGSQYLGEIIKSKELQKIYHCLVPGKLTISERLTGYLWKDARSNKVMIFKTAEEIPADKKKDSALIDTSFKTLKINQNNTLLEVQLFTGKTHQIRAHLASMGHPIIGDAKYGNAQINKEYRKCGIHTQLLHAYQVVFPKTKQEQWQEVSNQTFFCQEPDTFTVAQNK